MFIIFIRQVHSFQIALISDGNVTFYLLYFSDIKFHYYYHCNIFIGFNFNYTLTTLPGFQYLTTPELVSSSNIGVPGLFAYRVDQEDVMMPVWRNNSQNYSFNSSSCLCGAKPTILVEVPQSVMENESEIEICLKIYSVLQHNVVLTISSSGVTATG